MKTKMFFLLFCLFFGQTTRPEGFVAGTLVKTPEGYIPIEEIKEGDNVNCFSPFGDAPAKPVVQIVKKKTASLVKISLDDEVIFAAPDQLFFNGSSNGTIFWIKAGTLESDSSLNKIKLSNVEKLDAETDVYDISVATFGNYIISEHDICVHNTGIEIGILIAIGGGVVVEKITAAICIGAVVIGAALACGSQRPQPKPNQYGCYGQLNEDSLYHNPYAANNSNGNAQRSSPKKKLPQPVLACSGGNNPNDPRKPKDPRDPRNRFNFTPGKTPGKPDRPFGLYIDAPYHHKVGNAWKSARPINGQHALDNSIPIIDSPSGRIALSHGQIVVLSQTSPGLYHGHVREWGQLTEEMKRTLQKENLTNHRGKILKKQI